MSFDGNTERLEEIRRILPERTRIAEQLAAIDRHIAELAGTALQEQRKSIRKTYTRDEFTKGCGL